MGYNPSPSEVETSLPRSCITTESGLFPTCSRGGFLADIEITNEMAALNDWVRMHPGSSVRGGMGPAHAANEHSAWLRRDLRRAQKLRRMDFGGFRRFGLATRSCSRPSGMEPCRDWCPGYPGHDETPTQPVAVIDAGTAQLPRPGTTWTSIGSFVCAHGVAYLGLHLVARGSLLEIRAGSQEALKLWLNGDAVISNFVNGTRSDQEKASVHFGRVEHCSRKGGPGRGAMALPVPSAWRRSDRCVYSRTTTRKHPRSMKSTRGGCLTLQQNR